MYEPDAEPVVRAVIKGIEDRGYTRRGNRWTHPEEGDIELARPTRKDDKMLFKMGGHNYSARSARALKKFEREFLGMIDAPRERRAKEKAELENPDIQSNPEILARLSDGSVVLLSVGGKDVMKLTKAGLRYEVEMIGRFTRGIAWPVLAKMIGGDIKFRVET